jgi:hypothetical protein
MVAEGKGWGVASIRDIDVAAYKLNMFCGTHIFGQER